MADTNLNIVVSARDDASKDIGKAQNSLSKLGSVAASVGKAVVAFGAAAGAAAVGFASVSVKEYSEVGDAVEKMSKRTGLGAEAVSALRVAADMGGTSIDTMEGALKKMQIGMDNIGSKGSTMEAVLRKNHTTLSEIKALSPELQFERLGNMIGSIADPTARVTAAFEVFGKSGTDLIPTFEGGTFSMAQWSEQAKKLGVSFDDLSAKNAAALNDAIGALTTAWNGLKLKVGGELAPVLTKFINEQLVPLAERILAAIPTLDQMKEGMNRMRTAFNTAIDDFNKKTGIVDQLRDAFDRINKVVQEELKPALERLWKAMQPLMPAIEALMKALGFLFVLGLKIVIEALARLIELTVKVWTTLSNFVAFVLENLQPMFAGMVQGFNDVAAAIGWVISKFNAMKDAAVSAFNAAQRAISSVPGVGAIVGAIKGKASGGPVSANSPYIVGEKGPELFVPSVGGTIIPNGASGGTGTPAGTSVNITIGNFWGGDPERAAREIGDMIIKRLQLNARVA